MEMKLEFNCNGQEGSKPAGFFDTSGVYLHGAAEDECGFDIPSCNIPLEKLDEGVYPAHLNGNSGYTLRLWRRMGIERGLIVRDDDANATKHAETCYNNKAAHL